MKASDGSLVGPAMVEHRDHVHFPVKDAEQRPASACSHIWSAPDEAHVMKLMCLICWTYVPSLVHCTFLLHDRLDLEGTLHIVLIRIV